MGLYQELMDDYPYQMGWILGIIGGVGLGLLINTYVVPPNIDSIKINRENSLSVARVCKPGKDGVFVEKDSSGVYFDLDKYLEQNFPNKYDRAAKKAELEKIAFSLDCK